MACCIPFYSVGFWSFQTRVHVSTTFLLRITTVDWQMYLVYNAIVTGFWIPNCSLSTYTWAITRRIVFSFVLFESILYAQDISCLKPFMCWTGTCSRTWWTYDHMCEWYALNVLMAMGIILKDKRTFYARVFLLLPLMIFKNLRWIFSNIFSPGSLCVILFFPEPTCT